MKIIPEEVNPGFAANVLSVQRAVSGARYAITVRHAYTQYRDVLKGIVSGNSPPTKVVLNNFNMTVQRGHIYALLGASGCGKTTVLRAIVGQHDLTSGEIRVLGHQPRTPRSGITGADIGYMPQEVSLFDNFTITETFCYFGQLAGMNNEAIQVETEKLVRLLDLPGRSRIVGTLSGGQKRRVSFAVALLHLPPVLIMDEPTVGLDPLLRESIWQYIKTVAEKNGITIVMTTHYIAEAIQADTVGLMRHGKLMAEQSPHSLMASLGCGDLEAVLYKLCLLESTKQSIISSVADLEHMGLPVNDSDLTSDMETIVHKNIPPFNRISTLVWKDILWLTRNHVYTLTLILLPIFVGFGTFFVTQAPTGMYVSVFNQEASCFFERNETINLREEESYCSMPTNLSCGILRYLKEKDILMVSSETEDSARNDVIRGRSWAALTFPKNFTSALIERLVYSRPLEVTEDVVDTGTLGVVMDQSDRIISFTIQQELSHALSKVLSDYDDQCHTLRSLKRIPMQFLRPVYGYFDTSRSDYVYPSVITALSFILPLVGTLCAMLPEKLEGTLERSFVSGVTMKEEVAATLFVYFPLTIVQVFILLAIPYYIYDLYMVGNIWISVLILLYLGNAGMILGFITALISTSVTFGVSFVTALYFFFLFTGGLAWPLDGVVSPVREFCLAMPLTLPSEALRYIALRGWSLVNRTPQLAIVSTTIWTIILLIILVAILRYHR